MKSIERAKLIARVNLVLTVVWILLVIPSVLFWKQSILWIVIMSVWANVSGHYSSYIAARAEVAGFEHPD